MPVSRLACLLVGLGSALLLGLTGPAADASCVGPALALGRSTPEATTGRRVPVHRGEEITVSGGWFRNGCSDVYVRSGCRTRPVEEETPLRGVRLQLVQGARHWTLGAADAGDRNTRYAISWRVRVPATARPGPARLEAQDAVLRVRIRR